MPFLMTRLKKIKINPWWPGQFSKMSKTRNILTSCGLIRDLWLQTIHVYYVLLCSSIMYLHKTYVVFRSPLVIALLWLITGLKQGNLEQNQYVFPQPSCLSIFRFAAAAAKPVTCWWHLFWSLIPSHPTVPSLSYDPLVL